MLSFESLDLNVISGDLTSDGGKSELALTLFTLLLLAHDYLGVKMDCKWNASVLVIFHATSSPLGKHYHGHYDRGPKQINERATDLPTECSSLALHAAMVIVCLISLPSVCT